MNEHYPEPSDQYNPQSGKLVLPAYHDATSPASEDANTTYIPMGQSASSPYDSPVQPELLRQNYASSYYDKIKPRSRTSPVQLILIIAIVVVLIATGSVAFAAVSLLSPAATKNNSATAQANSAKTQANATVAPTATPIPSPTPSPTAISTFDGAPLSLTIEDLPHSVNNGDSGDVTVQTNASGIPVHLQVTYAASPFNYTSDTQVTDDKGVATLTWNVQINPTRRKTNAQVVAVAQEANGQQIRSDTVNVRIIR